MRWKELSSLFAMAALVMMLSACEKEVVGPCIQGEHSAKSTGMPGDAGAAGANGATGDPEEGLPDAGISDDGDDLPDGGRNRKRLTN